MDWHVASIGVEVACANKITYSKILSETQGFGFKFYVSLRVKLFFLRIIQVLKLLIFFSFITALLKNVTPLSFTP